MAPQIRKAERRKAKLRLGIAAPSGAGKTYGALQLAFGLGGKVGMVDTECGSGDLYANMGEYDIISLQAPYTIAKYREAIKAFENAGYNSIIIDSLSHAWAGEGGLLDKQGKIADSSKSGNSYTAWRTITPEHNSLVNDMLASPCHIIATVRSKTEYVQEKDNNGRTVIKKVGLAPIQRDGLEYEFTIMLDVSVDHVATTSKDRTGMFDGEYFKMTQDTGKKLLGWLESGSEPIKLPTPDQENRAAYNAAKEQYVIPVLVTEDGDSDYWTFAADYEMALTRVGSMDDVSMLKKANSKTLKEIEQYSATLFENLKTKTGEAGQQFA